MCACRGHSIEMSGQFHDLDALRPMKEAMYRLNRRLNGEEENPLPVQKIDTRFLGGPACTLISILKIIQLRYFIEIQCKILDTKIK